MSCDLGQSWFDTCTLDGGGDGACKINDDDGDHTAWASTGLTWGDGAFLALYGWFGNDDTAHILRTRNGRDWEQVLGGANTAQGTFGTGIAYGQGAFVVNAQRSGTHYSADEGDSWTTTEFGAPSAPHRRNLIYIPYGAQGRFVSFGDSNRMTYSDDGGSTWVDTTASGCSTLTRRPAWGADTLVVTGHSEFCYSTDGGSTWTEQATDFGGGQLIFTGTEFYVPQTYAGRAWVSTDGRQFTEVSTTQHPGNAWPAVVGYGGGVMVGFSGDGASMFRSEDDGRTWTDVAGPAGTSITHVVYGYGAPTTDCPGP